jgi:hypothetical protein
MKDLVAISPEIPDELPDYSHFTHSRSHKEIIQACLPKSYQPSPA